MATIAQIDVKSLLRLDLSIDLVNNWTATSAVNDASTTKYATAAAVKSTYDYAATMVPIALRTDWSTKGVINKVIGQLAWRVNGNNSTIFDASASLSPSDTSVGNTNSSVAWAAGSPVLMGWNGTSTYGVRVDSSRSADVLNNSLVSATAKILTIDSKNALSGTSATQLVINPVAAWASLLVDSPLTVNGALDLGTAADGTKRGISGMVGTNDYWFVGGGSTAADAGYLEIATGDNANEPVYVRQYTGSPVSGGTISRTATLLDATGATSFPVQVTAPTYYASNWYHSTGATGWVNDTYAGGVYMTDATWLRIYGGKKFYVSNAESDSIYAVGGIKSMLKMAVDGAAWLAANTTHTAAVLRQTSSPISVDFGTVSGVDDYYPIIDGRSVATTYGYNSRVSLGMYRVGGGTFSQAALVVGSAESANTTYATYTFDAYGKATAVTLNATGEAIGQGLAYNSKTAIGGDNDAWLRLNPSSDFTSGVYSPTLIRSDAGFQVGSAGSYFAVSAAGKVTAAGELITTSANGLRHVQGSYGAFWRNDGTNFYLMLTASADQYGSYNALRPFYANVVTGAVVMGVSATSPLFNANSVAGGYQYDSKLAIGGASDWLRLNPSGSFASGIYCGTSVVRTDGSLQVGNAGATFLASATAFSYLGNAIYHAGNKPTPADIGALAASANAVSATVLQTARTINGVSFNGSANIVVEPYIELDTATAATRYLTFVDTATAGYQRLNMDTELSYNPSTNLLGTSISGNAATATTATNVSGGSVSATTGSFSGRLLAVGSGNDYHTGAVELRGNGAANTIFPTLGFHQPSLYASSLQLVAGADFRFYAQGAGSYADVTAKVFHGALDGNAATATKLATGRTITLSGEVSGSATFDGSANIIISASVADGSSRVGEVVTFARSSAPTGYLKCNGAAISRTTYAYLFAAIGTTFGAGDGSTTFNVPDLRGEYIRGWDDARGADPSRVFGSWQDGQNLWHGHGASTGAYYHAHSWSGTTSTVGNHQHGTGMYSAAVGNGSSLDADEVKGNGSGGGFLTSASGSHAHTISGGTSGDTHSHTVSIDGSGGSEVRVRNRALLYCIKY